MATSSSSATLERGRACLRCRRRKIRCDGVRPSCRQCTNADRADDCEYSDGHGPTASQILEDQVSQLQLRIAELESVNAPPLTLFDPYESFSASQASSGALPSQQRNRTLHTLLRTFFHNSSAVGFFLHIQRFLQQVTSPPSTGYPTHLSLLLNAIYLIGAQFSTDVQLRAEQSAFLANVLKTLSPALSGSANNTAIMYVLQTEILLTHYFLDNNRDMEASYHWRAATSVVLACRLHKIRSSRPPNPGQAGSVQYQLTGPVDGVDEGERINAFWQVFLIDKFLSAHLRSPSAFTEDESKGTVIDTPWPVEVDAYAANPLPPRAQGMLTVQNYMRNLGAPNANQEQYYIALLAKASLLYAHSCDLEKMWNPNDRTFMNRFTYLDNGIGRFQRDLPPIASVDSARPDLIRKLLTIHFLAHCCTLQLNKPLEQPAVAYQGKSWTTATTAVLVLQQVNLGTLQCMAPGVAILLHIIADVIVRGLMTLNAQNALDLSNQAALLTPLSQILSAMDRWGVTSPLFRHQRTAVQDMLSHI